MTLSHVTQAIATRLTHATLKDNIQDVNSGFQQNQLNSSILHSQSQGQQYVRTTSNDAGKRGKAMTNGTHHTRTDVNTRNTEATRPHAQVERHTMDHSLMAVLHRLPHMRTGTMTGATGMRTITGMVLPGMIDRVL